MSDLTWFKRASLPPTEGKGRAHLKPRKLNTEQEQLGKTFDFVLNRPVIPALRFFLHSDLFLCEVSKKDYCGRCHQALRAEIFVIVSKLNNRTNAILGGAIISGLIDRTFHVLRH